MPVDRSPLDVAREALEYIAHGTFPPDASSALVISDMRMIAREAIAALASSEPAGNEAAKLAEYFLSLREDEMPLSNPDLWANITRAERDIIVAALLASKARTGETESKER